MLGDFPAAGAQMVNAPSLKTIPPSPAGIAVELVRALNMERPSLALQSHHQHFLAIIENPRTTPAAVPMFSAIVAVVAFKGWGWRLHGE